MKKYQYSSIHMHQSLILNAVNYLYLTDPIHNDKRLVIYPEDGDTLFFLNNSYYMNTNCMHHKEHKPLKLVYKPRQL